MAEQNSRAAPSWPVPQWWWPLHLEPLGGMQECGHFLSMDISRVQKLHGTHLFFMWPLPAQNSDWPSQWWWPSQ